ncbi:fimbria/pilus outer membrane usher protein [Rhodanobacter sp. FDAARGOS 1247]|uniref:fimbria/pilus outer membrane usher protein n=1 Tax=Rhodanobacter sp. FDAARGOS 1247 TaxID=2778082 RepID=UPI001EF4E986|nr:fimbria/pilus outer membrane usher protein [Rhodanobacter sp. FDAARGOS 1247]
MSAIGGTDLYLDVTLNGSNNGLAHFGYRDGELWASMATLRQLGFALPASTLDPVRLNSLQGVQVSYNQEQQSVAIVAPLKLLNLSTHVLNTSQQTAQKASASPGLLLNYDLYGAYGERGASSLSAFTELRAFGESGVLSNTSLSRMAHADGAWHNQSVRMDTNWSRSFPDKMLTLRVGDTLTAASSWSRPTRIGGVQFGTNFSLQPYRITTPLPQFLGSATLPSQVELYVNGMKQYSGNVPAGPFQLDTIPSISGAGQAQVMLTDALGRVTTLDFSLYNSQQLLQKGLTDWSAELGVVRESYGLHSFDYGHDPIGSGTWRHGVSNDFTAEVHGEATAGLINAGAGGSWLLGRAGVVSGSVASSQRAGIKGSQLSLGYSWLNSRFNFAVQGMRASNGYRDVAALYSASPANLSASAQGGFSTEQLGSFGMSYVQLRYQGQVDTRYASAYWYKSIGRQMSLNFNVNQNLGQSRDRSFFLNVSLSLDNSTYLSAGVQHDHSGNRYSVNASHSVPGAGGFGWLAQAQQGEGSHGGRAELDYLGRYGQVQAGASSLDGNFSGYAGANGSLVYMGGHLFASRRIFDGFAVVSTDGIANVPVRLENNPIGTTDKHGMMLVSPLNAYQDNRLSIDPMDLPADVRIARVDAIATPTDRSGTMVHFGITPLRAAAITLIDATGKPLALGSMVQVNGHTGEPALVGFDGAAYLDTLDVHNVLDVNTPKGICHAQFDYQKRGDGVPQIGPLTCTYGASP